MLHGILHCRSGQDVFSAIALYQLANLCIFLGHKTTLLQLTSKQDCKKGDSIVLLLGLLAVHITMVL